MRNALYASTEPNLGTQCGKIVQYIRQNGGITVREAFDQLHINSPTKRISELKQSGYDVRTEWQSHKNADGKTTRYLRYTIHDLDN